jgi:hypothetical protein
MRRHLPYVVMLVVAAFVVTVAPNASRSNDTTAVDGGRGTAPGGSTGALAEAITGDTTDAASDATGSGSGSGSTAAPSSGSQTGSTSTPVDAPGIGSEAALAAPDCDRSAGKIRISFIWRPACVVPWPAGADNGGATATGVTATSIRVVRYNDPVQPISDDELKRKWQTSIDLFEHFYRMWGRKVENIVVGKSGDDEVAQRADAVKIASLKPFIATGVPSTDQVLITELVARKIIVVTNSNVPVELSLKLAPYVWGPTIQPDELVALNIGTYAGKRLLGRPARWAGQAEYKAQTRKFGVIYPDTLNPKYFNDAFSKYGGKVTESMSYPAGQANASLWGERSRVIAAKMHSSGVTSVIAITDLLFTNPMTQAAATQNWFPEWITTGYLAQDLDIVAATYNQAEWRNAFGVAGIPIASGEMAPWPQYWFYLWYYGNSDNQDGPAHSEATIIFSGIHAAGPHLTVESFRDGVFALPPAGGSIISAQIAAQHSFGRHGFFPWDDYNAFDDFDEVYWDTTAIAPDLVTGQNTAGHYRHLNGGRRYTVDRWPSGEPKMFDPAGTQMFYTSYPPNDRPPDYPCTGCPSQQR